jgi:hypothetical protein
MMGVTVDVLNWMNLVLDICKDITNNEHAFCRICRWTSTKKKGCTWTRVMHKAVFVLFVTTSAMPSICSSMSRNILNKTSTETLFSELKSFEHCSQ